MTPMRVRKALAVGISSAFLGLQLLVMQPAGGFEGSWYWPFVNYPMYADAKFAGDSVHVRELRAWPCGGDTPRTLAFHDVHLWPAQFQRELALMAGAGARDPRRTEEARDAVERMDRRLRRSGGGRICRAELWEKSAVLDRELEYTRHAEWRPVRRWTVGKPVVRPPDEP